MPIKLIVQHCGHCGNTTGFTLAAVGSHPDVVTAEATTWTIWRVLRCSTCAQVTLESNVQEIKGPIGLAPTGRSETPTILYPTERSAHWQNIPPMVFEMYTEALKVEKISPRACAVMAGLTLETICEEEQAKGTSLAEHLHYLAQSGRIPQTLVEMAHHLRYFRNISAHALGQKVTSEDVPVLLYFVEAILEYLYVAPATIQAVEARLHGRVKQEVTLENKEAGVE